MSFAEVARIGDIPAGTLKHVEAGGRELCIANAGGKFYAFVDRCPHMNARLSMGTLQGTTVTCPFHFARFDAATGRKLYGPEALTFEGSHIHPPEFDAYLEKVAGIMAPIRTYDLETFPVRVEGLAVLVDVGP